MRTWSVNSHLFMVFSPCYVDLFRRPDSIEAPDVQAPENIRALWDIPQGLSAFRAFPSALLRIVYFRANFGAPV